MCEAPLWRNQLRFMQGSEQRLQFQAVGGEAASPVGGWRRGFTERTESKGKYVHKARAATLFRDDLPVAARLPWPLLPSLPTLGWYQTVHFPTASTTGFWLCRFLCLRTEKQNHNLCYPLRFPQEYSTSEVY